jgi:hypothetical protein
LSRTAVRTDLLRDLSDRWAAKLAGNHANQRVHIILQFAVKVSAYF